MRASTADGAHGHSVTGGTPTRTPGTSPPREVNRCRTSPGPRLQSQGFKCGFSRGREEWENLSAEAAACFGETDRALILLDKNRKLGTARRELEPEQLACLAGTSGV